MLDLPLHFGIIIYLYFISTLNFGGGGLHKFDQLMQIVRLTEFNLSSKESFNNSEKRT